MLALQCPSNHLQLPGEILGKIKGIKETREANAVLQSPPAPESPARCVLPSPALPAQVQPRGQAAAPALSPRVPGVASGESFDQRRQDGRPAPPIPIPSLNVGSLICRCRARAEENTREHQSPVAQDVEHRALQRLCSSLSAPAPPLSGTSGAAPAQPCCTPSLCGHPKVGKDNLAATIEVRAQAMAAGDLPAFYHSILPIYSGSAELPLWGSGAVPPERISAQVSEAS